MEVFWTKRCQYIVAVAAAELQQIFPMNHKIIIQVYTLCHEKHYNDVIMGAIASQITSLTIVYSNDYSDADQKKKSKLRVTGLCAGNSPVTGEFPAQIASNAENISIWWRHHGMPIFNKFRDVLVTESSHLSCDACSRFRGNCCAILHNYRATGNGNVNTS